MSRDRSIIAIVATLGSLLAPIGVAVATGAHGTPCVPSQIVTCPR